MFLYKTLKNKFRGDAAKIAEKEVEQRNTIRCSKTDACSSGCVQNNSAETKIRTANIKDVQSYQHTETTVSHFSPTETKHAAADFNRKESAPEEQHLAKQNLKSNNTSVLSVKIDVKKQGANENQHGKSVIRNLNVSSKSPIKSNVSENVPKKQPAPAFIKTIQNSKEFKVHKQNETDPCKSISNIDLNRSEDIIPEVLPQIEKKLDSFSEWQEQLCNSVAYKELEKTVNNVKFHPTTDKKLFSFTTDASPHKHRSRKPPIKTQNDIQLQPGNKKTVAMKHSGEKPQGPVNVTADLMYSKHSHVTKIPVPVKCKIPDQLAILKNDVVTTKTIVAMNVPVDSTQMNNKFPNKNPVEEGKKEALVPISNVLSISKVNEETKANNTTTKFVNDVPREQSDIYFGAVVDLKQSHPKQRKTILKNITIDTPVKLQVAEPNHQVKDLTQQSKETENTTIKNKDVKAEIERLNNLADKYNVADFIEEKLREQKFNDSETLKVLSYCVDEVKALLRKEEQKKNKEDDILMENLSCLQKRQQHEVEQKQIKDNQRKIQASETENKETYAKKGLIRFLLPPTHLEMISDISCPVVSNKTKTPTTKKLTSKKKLRKDKKQHFVHTNALARMNKETKLLLNEEKEPVKGSDKDGSVKVEHLDQVKGTPSVEVKDKIDESESPIQQKIRELRSYLESIHQSTCYQDRWKQQFPDYNSDTIYKVDDLIAGENAQTSLYDFNSNLHKYIEKAYARKESTIIEVNQEFENSYERRLITTDTSDEKENGDKMISPVDYPAKRKKLELTDDVIELQHILQHFFANDNCDRIDQCDGLNRNEQSMENVNGSFIAVSTCGTNDQADNNSIHTVDKPLIQGYFGKNPVSPAPIETYRTYLSISTKKDEQKIVEREQEQAFEQQQSNQNQKRKQQQQQESHQKQLKREIKQSKQQKQQQLRKNKVKQKHQKQVQKQQQQQQCGQKQAKIEIKQDQLQQEQIKVQTEHIEEEDEHKSQQQYEQSDIEDELGEDFIISQTVKDLVRQNKALRRNKTKFGFTINDCVELHQQVKYETCERNIAFLACDSHCYIQYVDLLMPYLACLHANIMIRPNQIDINKKVLRKIGLINQDGVQSCAFELYRCLTDRVFPIACKNNNENLKMERILKDSCRPLNERFKGKISSLNFAEPCFQDLMNKGIIARHEDASSFCRSSVYKSATESSLVLMNYKSHLHIITTCTDGDVKKIVADALFILKSMEHCLRGKNESFLWHDQIGYINPDPLHLGMACTLTVRMTLNKLNKVFLNSLKDSILAKYGMEVFTHTYDNELKENVYNIRNTNQFGLSEIEMLKQMMAGVGVLEEINRHYLEKDAFGEILKREA